MLGGIFVPLNYRAKRPELEHMLGKGDARVLFVGERYLDLVESLQPSLAGLDTIVCFEDAAGGHRGYEDLIADVPEHEDEAEVEDDDSTILMYTSGTTALPKGVMLTHRDFTAYVTANVDLADGTPRGAALLCVPLYHIAGATNMMTTMWTGRRLVLMPQFERAAMARHGREGAHHARLRGADDAEAARSTNPTWAARSLEPDILSYGGAPCRSRSFAAPSSASRGTSAS